MFRSFPWPLVSLAPQITHLWRLKHTSWLADWKLRGLTESSSSWAESSLPLPELSGCLLIISLQSFGFFVLSVYFYLSIFPHVADQQWNYSLDIWTEAIQLGKFFFSFFFKKNKLAFTNSFVAVGLCGFELFKMKWSIWIFSRTVLHLTLFSRFKTATKGIWEVFMTGPKMYAALSNWESGNCAVYGW